MTKAVSRFLGSALIFSTLAGSAHAGGLERSGYSWDQLFDTQRFSTEAGVTYVMPKRKLKNVVDTDPSDGVGANGVPQLGLGDTSGNMSEAFAVPRFGAKVGITPDLDCLGTYSQPWGGHSKPGAKWVGANSEIETKIDSHDYGLTCSYKFDVGKGSLRAIGGVSYQEIEGFKDRLVLSPNIIKSQALLSRYPAEVRPVVGPMLAAYKGDGTGRIALEGDGVGWRLGAAYEIPEIALRGSLIYNAAIDYDITGSLDLSKLPALPAALAFNPLFGANTPIFANVTLPQSVEFKLQSGIAPDWLAFGSVKWVDWSVLGIVPICKTGTQACTAQNSATSFDLMYRDGWTVSGGIGHKFNDQWSGAAQLAWDRGTSTGNSAQTDAWTLSGGVGFSPNEKFEVRVGGAVGLMTGGSTQVISCPNVSGRCGADVKYDFEDDFVSAISVSGKLKF